MNTFVTSEFRARRGLIQAIAGAGLGYGFSGFLQPACAAAGDGIRPELTVVSTQHPWFVELSNAPSESSASPSARISTTGLTPVNMAPVQRATHWARQWLKLVVKYQQNPLRAARSIAHVHVALHDAWLHAGRRGMSSAMCELSAHRAASLVLNHFYPNETSGQIEAQYAWLQAQLVGSDDDDQRAQAIGIQVAQAVIDRSLRDGAGRTWPIKNRPSDFPGMWQATYPLYAVNPAEAFAGEWRTWLPESPNRYQPPAPPRPGSPSHLQESQEVLNVARQLSHAQRDAAERWNLEAGSVTPAGVWMQHALELLLRSRIQGNPFETSSVVLAAVSVAMEDAFIACWRIKFRDWSERPITAIRRDLNKDFVPLLVTPGFPSYVSGHATVSAAVAKVMSSFWPGETTRLTAMAEEAAMSRLWGGIHFRGDNDEGIRLGNSVGTDLLTAQARS